MTTWADTLPAAPVMPQRLPAAAFDALYGILLALSDAWSDYTAVWTSTGTAPAIVNGTLASRYAQVGKLVVYTGALVAGAGTTFGTGTWSISLPVAAAPARAGIGLYTAPAYLHDQSVIANRRTGAAVVATASTMQFYSAGGGAVTPSNPFTWTNLDKFSWMIIYEAA